MATDSDILNLEKVVDSLPGAEKALFRRIYGVTTVVGELRLPPGMRPWVEQQFGSVAAVTRQKIVRVTNKLTLEETLFGKVRGARPIEALVTGSADALTYADTPDLLASPLEHTPEDNFGRVVGKYSVTASNIAKFDGSHGLVIFNEFSPLQFSREQIIDYISVAREWAEKERAAKPEAKYFMLIWNCLWRAGASIDHGHAHVMLASGQHYAKIERLRQAAVSYRQSNGANYFSDLFQAHRAIDCAIEKGDVRILAYLTPFKNNEAVLIAGELNLSFQERLYEVLTCFRDRLGIRSFNLSLVTPPLAETEESWEDFPVMVRLVDRGDPNRRASDVGGMEVYAASVASSDPFQLTDALREYLKTEENDG